MTEITLIYMFTKSQNGKAWSAELAFDHLVNQPIFQVIGLNSKCAAVGKVPIEIHLQSLSFET